MKYKNFLLRAVNLRICWSRLVLPSMLKKSLGKEAEEIKIENERKYITVMLTEAVSVVLMKIKTE